MLPSTSREGFTLFFVDSSKNLVWNARKTVGPIVDAKRAIV